MAKFVLNEKVPFEEGNNCEFKSLAGAIHPVPHRRHTNYLLRNRYAKGVSNEF